ncbi:MULTISPECIES: TolC family outer membrane protein [Bradyrhizobium]|uniref:Outer membrane protein n=1 Tax=Bradyrhizobium yuanmingense TaxID=108015 RepID=A0A1C3TXP7_9BRAD|nr:MULTISPECIES: TolC family outer membrane protein [Bradyrhizobium]MCA1391003.1 TolC family outer membrane protein [Bradyrhizobium sp. IC3123]MCA1437465.1 TolC family outer membrane protein [Bradyrhizobium sp. BRP20]MCA1496384.1 TolC family outer membrane protein [Bradyrhizobium sp. NBAIM14]MCA1502710.1 TolC family outer membrane protein [Bradyrhizobium sp. NBAIM02]MCA1525104.1 TolC family outer membrane protein [Bradyrhizobium yuanmingense]
MIGRTARAGRGVTRRRSSAGHALATWTTLAFSCALPSAAWAEALPDALAKAYQTNPQLNAERARQRATDENVPQALAGYRPQIVASLSAGLQSVRNLLPDNTIQTGNLKPWIIGVTVTQSLFNGFRTANGVRAAELQVQSGREALRNVGQGVLLDAVTAYTNVLANQSLVEAQRSNVAFLRETLSVTQRRLNAGDVTPTDTAQAEARLNRGLADLNAAEVALAVSQATYAQVIGNAPSQLRPAEAVDRYLPKSREDAMTMAIRQHPAVMAASFDVDVASTNIRIAEGTLLPSATIQGSASKSRNNDPALSTLAEDQASIVANVTAPIYDGGQAAAQTRQAKEITAQSRLVLDQVRNQARTAAVSAWVANEGAKITVSASESEVKAATVALQGVQREAAGGQRTTVDVLNSQADLIQAKARLIGAQRDRVIASYTLLSAIGHLDVKTLNLNTPDYLPEVHYHQVRDAWHGLRTPSGQ